MSKRRFIARNMLALIALIAFDNALYSQSSDQQNTIKALAAETTRHSVLTYVQRYIDDENKVVGYSGTLYLHIESVTLHGCNLQINVVVQDKYSEVAQKQEPAGKRALLREQQSFTYRYTYQLNLMNIESLQADSPIGRPNQLQNYTGATCEEDKFCNLQWLRIKTAKPAIKETRTLNGLLDFDQTVDTITIPITSHEIALQSAAYLQDITATCH
jgi:hypothetical protein